ncbi:hypothetical protein Tco_0352526 [Tanacetum coccineum]
MNKDKKVRFAEPVTSSSNIPKQIDSLRTIDYNKPLLTSTGVNTTTSASGSKPSGSTKKNKISNTLVKHSVRNAKFESICAICNKCLFDVNHDMCIMDYVNVRSKSKSKRNKIRKVWKPTGKVFSEIGYTWKPTDSIIPIGQKNTLVEYMILSGADNRPPILDKDLYDSWKSIMELYMQNGEHERMILELVEHDPLIWPTVEENGVTRTKKYAELSAAEKIQANYDMKATNIILQDLHTTNFDQLHAYLKQHELHANEIRLLREHNPDPLAFVANQQMTPLHFNTYQSSYNNPQLQHGLAILVFSPGDDLIACLNKAMTFLIAVASLRFPSTNNQLRTSSNPRNQATIQDGRVIVQQVQGRQGQSYSGEGHMVRQCTQPKQLRNATCYKDKAMLAEAQEAR